LEESGVAGVTESSTSQSASTLRHLLDETADLIESPTFGRVLQALNDECFDLLMQNCIKEAFQSSPQASESVPQSFTSVATVVPQVKTVDLKTKLANVLAVMARQAHVIGNGTNPPNMYLTAMDQNVRNLEAFAAVIYSSNFDFQPPGAEQKGEQFAAERDRPDTPSTAPVMVDKDDTQDLNQAGSSAVGEDNSAFEKAWGKAVEEGSSE
jgi:peroxin-3